MPAVERIDLLARRVRWLDRYRRAISVVIALVMLPLSMRRIAHVLGSEWPEAHVTMLGVLAAVTTWWTVEVSLAWFAAVWDTEHDRLTRDSRLPRAQLVLRRR